MNSAGVSSSLIRAARARAAITQRELARRASTAQSVVARIESGATSPTWETFERLLTACGFTLDAQLVAAVVTGTHMLDDVARILALTPEQRLAEVANVDRFILEARRA